MFKWQEEIKKLNPIDDIAFKKMAEEGAFCTEMLQAFLEQENLRITKWMPQYHVTNLQGRSVVLDLFCVRETGDLVFVEIQKANDDDHERRMRYGNALLTANHTPTGVRFADVPEIYAICVTRFDIFKMGRAVYHVDRVIRETGERTDNGIHEIYINAAVDDGSKIAELMKVFVKDDYYSDTFPVASALKHRMKHTEEGARVMSEEFKKFLNEEKAASEKKGREEGEKKGREEGERKGREEGEKKGREEGEKKGREDTLFALVKEGLLSLTVAAQKAGMSEEAFRKAAML